MYKPQSLVSIDILRALAALGVFYYHQHTGAALAHYSGMNWLNITDSFGAVYAVPLFFLISGYCIHLSNIKYLKNNQPLPLKGYYKRRFLRIYPAYLAALVFSFSVNLFTHYNPVVTPTDFLVHVFMLQGFSTAYFNSINVVLWTISIEAAFYMLYPVFYYLRLRYSLNRALLFTLAVSCTSILFFSTKGYTSNPAEFCVLNIWFAWCCGAFIADKKATDEYNFYKPFYLLCYLIIVIVFLGFKYYPGKLVILSYQFNILLWTAPLVWLLSKEDWLRQQQNLWITKMLAAIGLSSYSLYLLHSPLIDLKNFMVHAILPQKLQPAGILIGFLVIPAVAWLSFKYIEKPFIAGKRKQPADAGFAGSHPS